MRHSQERNATGEVVFIIISVDFIFEATQQFSMQLKSEFIYLLIYALYTTYEYCISNEL
jgi:hypothetical protein